MIFRSITLALFLGFPLFVFSQKTSYEDIRYFDIKLAGVRIGEMKATKTQQDSSIYYTLDSKVSFWFFVSVSVDYTSQALYQNGKLVYSKSTSKSNKGNYGSAIVWNKDHYDVDVTNYDYSNKKSIQKSISHNVATLHFEEPKQVKELLIDGFGLMTPVTRLKEGTYQLEVMGNINTYQYKDGKLITANMYSKLKNYHLVVKEDDN